MSRRFSWTAPMLAGAFLLAACGAADPPATEGANQPITQPTPGNDQGTSTPGNDQGTSTGENTIVVGSAPTLRPLEFLNEKNEVDGLVIDLLRAAADEFGADLSFETLSFDALIPAVQSERIDMVTSMGNLPERRNTLTFIVYLESGAGLLVPDGNPATVDGPEDLCGLAVAFTRGSAQQVFTEKANEQCVANGEPEITLAAYPGSSESVLALRSGQADAAWTDRVNAAFVQEQTPETFALAFSEPGYGYGIGIPQENEELLRNFATALQTLRENGTYAELVEEWGLTESILEELTINGEQSLDAFLSGSAEPTPTPTAS